MNEAKGKANASLPHYEDYEKNILGCILEDGKLIDQVAGVLTSEDFYFTQHQIIFGCILKMQDNQILIDIITAMEYLEKQRLLEEAGGFAYLGYLKEIAISPANIGYHVEKVKEASLKRNLWEKSQRFTQVIERGADREEIRTLQEELAKFQVVGNSQRKIIRLCDIPRPQPGEKKWLIEKAFPLRFPSIIYADGGIGKSYLGLYFATLAALGGQSFLGYKFYPEPLRTLFLDFELDQGEIKERALQIAKGLDLSHEPERLSYYDPKKSLPKLLPELKRLIPSEGIQFLIIDSLGAGCVDPDKVIDIVEIFSEITSFGIATLCLDHQSKMQSQDSYNLKTPYGSVYKFNLSRSVFQLSCMGREKNQITLMLRHKKSNFGRLLDDLIFDISFDGDQVQFFESKALSPEEKEMMVIHEAMGELEGNNEKVNQRNLILHLKGLLGRDRIVGLLEKGEGKYWDKKPGDRKEILYKSKTLKTGYI